MAHQIFGDRFLGRREPAWHGLGEVFAADEQLTASDAFERAHLLYEFTKVPLHVTAPDGTVQVLDKVAVMREPTPDDPVWRTINIAEPDFGIIQNRDLAAHLNPISERWPVETVGALQDGATTFATFKTGEYDIAKDAIGQYLLISDGKGGNHALRIALVDIRVVCANTLEAAWSSTNSLRVMFPHHANVATDLKQYTTLFDSIAAAQERQRQAFETLAATRITRTDAQGVITAAYPLPNLPRKTAMLNALLDRNGFLPADAQELLSGQLATHDKYVERAKQFHSAGIELYDRLCDSNPLIAGTAWAAYNAAVELADCRAGDSHDAAESTLIGTRAVERGRAFRAAWDLVDASAN